VVAQINKYKLTVADFLGEAGTVLPDRPLPADAKKAKRDILEGLVTKKLLLQEAQAANLDKESGFMREIERYWEQALLKSLFKKKADELSGIIRVDENEVLDEYGRMKRRICANVVILKDRTHAEALAADAGKFEATKEAFKDNVISGVSPEWWVMGDLPPQLEGPLFSLKMGEVSQPIRYGDNWAVMRIRQESEMDIGPYDEVYPKIREHILRKKKEAALEGWVADLRKKAAVKIDEGLLEEIELKQ
jgi:hypothetical protein